MYSQTVEAPSEYPALWHRYCVITNISFLAQFNEKMYVAQYFEGEMLEVNESILWP